MSLPLTPDKMTTPQQKLKMKMTSIDTWSTREQLCLASSVLRSGDQNWVSVSRSLKSFAEPNRPSDWLSPRNCALQYNSLLEKTGGHKRTKRGDRHPSSGSTDSQQGETAGEIILKQLTLDRIEELQTLLETSKKEYQGLKRELDLVLEGKLDDKLAEICQRIDEENERKLEEQSSHLKWLEERERKQHELKQAQQLMLRTPSKTSIGQSEIIDAELAASSPSVTDQLNIDVSSSEETTREMPVPTDTTKASSSSLTPVPAAVTPSSPLLTSLLRSPTATATPGSANKASSSGVATKLSFNLASPSSMSPGLKNLVSTAIGEEQVPAKSVTTSPSTGTAAPTLTRLLELPLNSPGKPLPELTVGEETEVATAVSSPKSEERAEEVVVTSTEEKELPDTKPADVEGETQVPETVTKQSDDLGAVVKKETEPSPTGGQDTIQPIATVEEVVDKEVALEEESTTVDDEQTKETDMSPTSTGIESQVDVQQSSESDKVVEDKAVESLVEGEPEVIAKTEPIDEDIVASKQEEEKTRERNNESAEDKTEEIKDVKEELKSPDAEAAAVSESGTPKLTRRPLRGMRWKGQRAETDGSADDTIKVPETGPTTRRSSGRKGVQVEEQQDAEAVVAAAPAESTEVQPSSSSGKKKTPLPPPIYIPSPSPAPSSGIDSTPASPTSSVSTVTEDDRDYRTWKKSILLVWREIASHKNASLFAKPITEDHVPGYRSVIMRPMDLSTIKKNIESGVIRSTAEFHRDVSLMFLNSIFYNPPCHEVNRLAKEMSAETNTIIQEFMNAQLLAAHNMESTRPQRRETREQARRTESLSSHEETPSKQPEEGKTRAAKRASAIALATEDVPTVKVTRRSRAQNE